MVKREDHGVITLEDRISSHTLPDLMQAYADSGKAAAVRIDFSRMEFIDITGINALIKLHGKARSEGKMLIAQGLSSRFRDVFTAAHLDEAIVLEPGRVRDDQDVSAQTLPWARPVDRLKVGVVPEGALNLNIDGFKTSGPVQGFGHLWEKTYRIKLAGAGVTPKEAIRVLKEKFPSFQPVQNRFYPSPEGIAPGEIVIINAATPAGLISTGVQVLYADDEAFTFMTPQGHPESGWVSFSAFDSDGVTTVQVQGFARASDPMFEIGFVLMGAREQERIWKHVLVSLGRHFGVFESVAMEKTCVLCDYQWGRMGNLWYNAQIRTMLHTVKKALGY